MCRVVAVKDLAEAADLGPATVRELLGQLLVAERVGRHDALEVGSVPAAIGQGKAQGSSRRGPDPSGPGIATRPGQGVSEGVLCSVGRILSSLLGPRESRPCRCARVSADA